MGFVSLPATTDTDWALLSYRVDFSLISKHTLITEDGEKYKEHKSCL